MFLRYFHLVSIAFLFFLTVLCTNVFAQNLVDNSIYLEQTNREEIKVGVHISPPFVMIDQGKLTGMAVDLWADLSQELNLKSTYIEYETVQELIENIKNQTIDIAVTNLTITKERAKNIGLTHPWFDSGLRVMVSEDQSTSFTQIIKGLNESGYLRIYLWIAAMIVFAAAVITVYDRHFDKEFPRAWRCWLRLRLQ